MNRVQSADTYFGCWHEDRVNRLKRITTTAGVQNSCEDSFSILASTGLTRLKIKEGVPTTLMRRAAASILIFRLNGGESEIRFESRGCFGPKGSHALLL